MRGLDYGLPELPGIYLELGSDYCESEISNDPVHVRLLALVMLCDLLNANVICIADFSGRVVGIIDSDTLKALHNQHSERIRLSSIDCQEKGQAFGKRAKQAASELVYGKEVTIQTHGYDKYKRTLADVLLPDGVNLNQELVKQGWCWWYRKYASRDMVLEGLETEAREAKRGLWADPQPVPPWEWRKRQEH